MNINIWDKNVKSKISWKILETLLGLAIVGSIMAQTVDAESAQPIPFGETISGYINSTAQMDTYTFSANSGDRINIRMDSSWANGPEISLYAPNGTLINYASGGPCGSSCNTYASEITTLPLIEVYIPSWQEIMKDMTLENMEFMSRGLTIRETQHLSGLVKLNLRILIQPPRWILTHSL
jgi:hypothetical protein